VAGSEAAASRRGSGAWVRANLDAEPGAATQPVSGVRPLILLLRDTIGAPSDVRRCAELLIDAGASPSCTTPSADGEWELTASYYAVQRSDLALLRLLVDPPARLSGARARLDPPGTGAAGPASTTRHRLPVRLAR